MPSFFLHNNLCYFFPFHNRFTYCHSPFRHYCKHSPIHFRFWGMFPLFSNSQGLAARQRWIDETLLPIRALLRLPCPSLGCILTNGSPLHSTNLNEHSGIYTETWCILSISILVSPSFSKIPNHRDLRFQRVR